MVTHSQVRIVLCRPSHPGNIGAAALRSGEEFIPGRVVHHAVLDRAPVLQRDGDAVLREAVDEVGGAVQRIDDPAVFRLRGRAAGILPFHGARFLAEDGVIRVGLADDVDDR